jgi:hypothetical protein
MRKIITTLFISTSLLTTPTFAEGCNEKGEEIVKMYEDLHANIEEASKLEEVTLEHCEIFENYYETGKQMMIKNAQYKQECDEDGVFGESEGVVTFMVGGLGAASKSCFDDVLNSEK